MVSGAKECNLKGSAPMILRQLDLNAESRAPGSIVPRAEVLHLKQVLWHPFGARTH